MKIRCRKVGNLVGPGWPPIWLIDYVDLEHGRSRWAAIDFPTALDIIRRMIRGEHLMGDR